MKTATPDCVLDGHALLGESPVWSIRDQTLWWADIYGKTINRFDPTTGANASWTVPGRPGSIALRYAGGLLVAMERGFAAFDPATGGVEDLAPIAGESGKPDNRLNDGRADRAGRFWVGTMRDPPRGESADGTLYCLERDQAVRAAVPGLHVSNGLAFSPDDKILYLSDSYVSVRTIWAFDFDLASGALRNRRVFVDTSGMPGRPDGAAVDADGCYWMAAADGWEIVRFTPAGKIDRRIPMPVQKPTMLAFGGSDLRTLFITSIGVNVDKAKQPLAGGLFAIDAGVKGLPEPPYRG